MRRLRHLFFPVVALLLCFLPASLIGCKSSHLTSDPPPPVSGKEKLLILPFKDMAAIYGENANIRCPLTGRLFMGGPVPQDMPEIMTTRLYELLKAETHYALITAHRLPEGVRALNPMSIAGPMEVAATGRRVGAVLVMTGHLYRFRERVGKKFAVESPASVAFDLHLMRVSDGRILWTGALDETQHSLSENLFNLGMFLERDGQWLTAREMAAHALKHVLKPILEP